MNKDMHLLVHASEIEAAREVPALAEMVKRYDQNVANLSGWEHVIQQARDEYVRDDVEIDAYPLISENDEGAWVSAWVWVSTTSDEDEEG